MRVTAGWLLLAIVILPFADAMTASRMASDCCCAAMAKGTCPLKRAAARECEDHRVHCSMGQADASSTAQLPRSLDSREQTTLTETSSRELVPSSALSFASPDNAHLTSRNPSPETPPPRFA
ncbi:MAG TPA: hypothetical protein VLC46_23025 [Thermoanaerobaculia bacterium]|nr:hypothetical protein [Thermoanaerobaculia bacterium]